MKFKKIFLYAFCLITCIIIIGCKNEKVDTKDNIRTKNEETITIERKFYDIFTSEPIPDDIYGKMIGKSIPKEGLVNRDDLAYLKIGYYGFDGEYHLGDMIVAKEIADEVLDIFKELYNKKYPIEKIRLIDEYDANDELSMSDNNTSAFSYRLIEGSDKLSNHAKGIAIDINPLMNPMVKGEVVSPKGGYDYLNREDIKKGMIIKGDAAYEAFTKRGWTWGGDWKSLKDYQHFEKIKK